MTYAIQIIACIVLAYAGIVSAGIGGLLAERDEEAPASIVFVFSALLITLAILVRP